MIVSVTASIIGGSTAYYIALTWTTMAIAYFEVSSANSLFIHLYLSIFPI